MNAYWTLIKTEIRLTLRQKAVIFFSFLMPLGFFSSSHSHSTPNRAAQFCK
jgi:hypothetical protein